VNEVRLPDRVLNGDFAGWLRDSMHARRISTRMLAMRVGVHHTTISRLLHDKRDPQLSTVIALVRVLGNDPTELRG
jgi:plasmid maintenance system antidote protein VapI